MTPQKDLKMASQKDIESVVAQMRDLIREVPSDIDASLKKDLYETSRKLQLALESPLDSVKRIAYGPLQLAVAKVACNLNLFVLLSNMSSEVSAEELSKTVDAEPLLLERILRYLASYGMINEVGEGKYSANHITKTFSHPGYQSGLSHHFDFHVPCYQALPKFLSDTDYRNPHDSANTPAQVAFNTNLPIFTWAASQPEMIPDFNNWMSCQHETNWLDAFPLEELSQAASSKLTTPLFVDIGGGIGHQCIALKKKVPNGSRPVVLQDLLMAVERAIPFDGVESMVHNFFEEQPVKGASYYYMRNILHDWPDAECRMLLNNIKPALSKHSKILVDEIILPNTGAHWQATHRDMVMLATLGAMERTERQWQALLGSVGLKIERIHSYNSWTSHGVMVVVPV